MPKETSAEILDIIKKQGIVLVIPDNDLSSKHFDIQIFYKNLTEEQKELLERELL